MQDKNIFILSDVESIVISHTYIDNDIVIDDIDRYGCFV